jgi:toxin ParE1/3/4
MRLVFVEPAERDLDSIIDYIAIDNPTAAERVYRAIAATIERLTAFPRWADPAACRAPANFRCPSCPI